MIDHRDLKAITNRIVAAYDPERIYLFGSYAKGEMTKRSDLDLIIVKRSNLPRKIRGRDMDALLADFAIDFDLLFVTPEELEVERNKSRTLLKTVMSTARLIYQRRPQPVCFFDEDIFERKRMPQG
jgi:predicted nucleotidyltransferase